MERRWVVMVIDSLRPYGAERVALDLAGALAANVDVLLVTCKGEVAESQAHVPRGVDHVHIGGPPRPVRRAAAAAARLALLLRQTRPLAVIGHMPLANMLVVAASATSRTPSIVTEHNVMSIARYGGRKWPATRLAMKAYLRRAGSVVGVSDAVSSDLVDTFGAPRDRVYTIYNPIDRERLMRSAAAGADAVRPRIAGEKRIAVVGRLKPAKGHDAALRALARLPDDYVLDVVGDGPLLCALVDQARALGLTKRVHFAGWQADAASWIKAADVVWVPSRFEGFGLVLAEAAMLGRRAIGTTAPGLHEVASRLDVPTVAPDDVEALASTTIAAMKLPPPPGAPWLSELTPARVAGRYLALASRVSGAGPTDVSPKEDPVDLQNFARRAVGKSGSRNDEVERSI
jgi:glycosyltransferase involved in cell wall biosynthesis